MRLALMLACLPLAACNVSFDSDSSGKGVAGTGSATSRSYAVADFTGVDLRGSDDVEVKVGPAFSVRAEGDKKSLDLLEIEKRGNTLRIGKKSRNSFDWGDRKGAKIYVTMPSIVSASVAGSGNLSVDKAGGEFSGDIAGSGNLTIAQIRGPAADLSIAGSGSIEAAGTVERLKMSIAGSGGIDGDGLTATKADVTIMGSGSARAQVNGEADVSIMGSGDAVLGGNAKCNVSKMGSGSARCGA